MKTRIIKILKWIALSVLGLIVVFMVLQRFEVFGSAMLNMSFRYDDNKMLSFFNESAMQPKINYLQVDGNNIRYLLWESNPQFPYVVFIHGAPGSLNDYIEYFKDERILDNANLISIDRLGYGYSEYGLMEPSLKIQALVIEKVISEACKHDNIIIVGHSYGGPIALQYAWSNPGKCVQVLLLAPAIDPENEKEVKIASLGISPWTKWAIPPAWQVASAEKVNHVHELQKLEPHLPEIETPVCLVHGTNDSLVPYANVSYAREKIKPDILEIISLEGVDHFLPWTHYDLVVKKLLSFVDKVK